MHYTTTILKKQVYVNSSTKVLQMDFEVALCIFIIFRYSIALYCWKPCSLVYHHGICRMQLNTCKPTALLPIPIPPFHISTNLKTKPAFNANTTVTMFIDFKFIYLTKSLTKKFILCNNIINNESITIHNVPITSQ